MPLPSWITRAGASLSAAALAGMIAVPDFSAREWDVELDGRPAHVRYCIRAFPSTEAEVGTVLRFVGECPRGWLHANGQYIGEELYPDLYAVLQSFAAPDTRSGSR